MLMSTSVYDDKTGVGTNGTSGGGGVDTVGASESAAVRRLSQTINDPTSKFNSFPMRQKKPKLKQAPKSSSSLQQHDGKAHINAKSNHHHQGSHHHHLLVTYTEEELELNVRSARYRSQENERLKQVIRSNFWPIRHPMRRYLWKSVLQLGGKKSGGGSGAGSDLGSSGDEAAHHGVNNKENHFRVELVANQSDYDRHLDRIFGKCKILEFIFKRNLNLKTFNFF